VSRGLLGVNISNVSPEIAATYGLQDNSGALVMAVTPGSAAELAGIEIDDVIVSINGVRPRDSGSLRNTIGLLRPGENVLVGIVRDGKEQTVTAVLGENTARTNVPATETAPKSKLDPVFEGAELVDNDPPAPGVLVLRVDPGSPAAERGLRPGDVISKVNRVPVANLADAMPLLEDARSIILEVQRGNRSQLILMR
jgi:S1-C subfamily serine protease